MYELLLAPVMLFATFVIINMEDPVLIFPKVKSKFLLMVMLPLKTTPPNPFILIVLTYPLNKEAGNVIGTGFEKTTIEEPFVASIIPLTTVGAEPKNVNAFGPRVSVPFVKPSTPYIFKKPPAVRPFPLFNVRLFKVKAGIVILNPLPPMVRLEVAPPAIVPLVILSESFSVRVFGPMENSPLVRVNLVDTIRLPDKFNPFELLLYRFAMVPVVKTEALSDWKLMPANVSAPVAVVALILPEPVNVMAPLMVRL